MDRLQELGTMAALDTIAADLGELFTELHRFEHPAAGPVADAIIKLRTALGVIDLG